MTFSGSGESYGQVRSWSVTFLAALAICLGLSSIGIEAASGMEIAQGNQVRSSSTARTMPALALTGRVIDAGRVLTPAQVAWISIVSKKLEDATKVQFVIATTPSLEGSTINAYTLKLANSWGLGDRVRNDGLLLMVAPNEHKVRIEVGKGLERVLPDAVCKRIINDMLPSLRHRTIGEGLMIGASELDKELRRKIVK